MPTRIKDSLWAEIRRIMGLNYKKLGVSGVDSLSADSAQGLERTPDVINQST